MTRTHTTHQSHHPSTLGSNGSHSQNAESGVVTGLSADEIYSDLAKLLTYIKSNLAAEQTGTSSFLMTPTQALLYAERVASYALHDYPRQFQGDTRITVLWDTLDRIVRTAAAWRTNRHGTGDRELITISEEIDMALAENRSL